MTGKKVGIKYQTYVYHDGLLSGFLPVARVGEEYPLHSEETVDLPPPSPPTTCRLIDHGGMVLAVPVYACEVVET